MERAIKHHFNKDIKEKVKQDYCRKDVWVLTLSDDQKVVFRSCSDYTDKFEREKFFYENVNKKLGHVCPEVYIIDGTCEYYEKSYQISEYIEGRNLGSCLYESEDFNEQMKKDMYYKMGEITANINQIEIDPNHPYVASRNSWEDYFAGKLYDALIQIVKNDFITTDEINKVCENMRARKASRTLSFLHRDIRPHNMIYNNGTLFVIDAEECEFGDPLNEITNISQVSKDYFLEGYRSIIDIDLENELYYYYQFELMGMLLDSHFNHDCMNSLTQHFVDTFNELKERILHYV